MSNKRTTMHDVAKALDISLSYVSKALNNHPVISAKMKELVRKKADELNYRHNSHAANLRRGSSKTLGVIVPHIDKSFFSEAIAGIEEACFENNYSLIICQSHDSYQKECLAIDTLIRQNVDGILISIAAETQLPDHIENIRSHGIELIQFDRYLDNLNGYKVVNDNEQVSYKVVKNFVEQGYKRIAYIGGPSHLAIFESRKRGYLNMLQEAGLAIDKRLMVDDYELSTEKALISATEMLQLTEPPDAFFTVSDHQALGVLNAADRLGLNVPGQLGIVGFANEAFTAMVKPALSSVDQKGRALGRCAANLYFAIADGNTLLTQSDLQIVQTEIIVRASSVR